MDRNELIRQCAFTSRDEALRWGASQVGNADDVSSGELFEAADATDAEAALQALKDGRATLVLPVPSRLSPDRSERLKIQEARRTLAGLNLTASDKKR